MDLTILVPVHNEAEYAKLAIQGIRGLGEELDGVEVILIDNASDDGLDEWAREQEDISYVYVEEGLTPWGEVLRQVIDEFSIDNDILLMQSRFVLLPGNLTKMQKVFDEAPGAAAVGCVTPHAALIAQQPLAAITDLNDVVAYERAHENDPLKSVMELDCGLLMLKKDVLGKNRLFNNDIWSLYALMKDISLELICSGYQLKVRRDVAVFEVQSGYSEAPSFQIKWDQDIDTLEKKWGMHYFMLSGRDVLTGLIDAKPSDSIRVMEVGCDCGASLLEVKNIFPGAYVIGCEISPASAKIASHVLDEVYVANIEEENLGIEAHSLDYVLFGDVLEHLHDPQKVLRYVGKLLKQGGKVIACIPNLMHISVIRQLLHGDFSYSDYGLLDRTHVHFFTGNEILRSFKDTGYEVEEFRHIDDAIQEEDEKIIDVLLSLDEEAERYMYTAYWYTIRGRICKTTEDEH